MKRISVREFGGPEVLKIEEAEDPRPGSGEVVVRVKAAGVNPYDTYMRAGNYGARNPELPYTPGSDAAGAIEAVGPDPMDPAAVTAQFAPLISAFPEALGDTTGGRAIVAESVLAKDQ